jgi:3-hydroxyisobutyrate dehydrogenase-like beta-hydroxyacid dehydrogenase
MPSAGVVGLGNMGSALTSNLVAAGYDVLVHDIAGPDRCPVGATFVDDVTSLAAVVPVVVLSLPDGDAVAAVAGAIAASTKRAMTHVVDTSTVGLRAARDVAALLGDAGIGYVDAPVSGGVAGAKARTLVVMYSGAPDACDAVGRLLEGLSDRRFHVGDEAGMAQALKLANNFLSATALAATSEAVVFCESVGLDMATVLEVLNASSGRSAASEDKFVNHVLPRTYASGFLNTLMAKDVELYLSAVESQSTPATVGALTTGIWRQFAEAQPDVDFTEVYRFVAEARPLRPASDRRQDSTRDFSARSAPA